jgi:hypothetical protein
MMPKLVPEQHSGKTILRPIDYSEATPKLASSTVFHPPSISVQHAYEPLGLLVEQEAQRIVSMRAMTTSELRARLHAFALAAIENEKRRA